jgi:flavin-dependent dehydrogenase
LPRPRKSRREGCACAGGRLLRDVETIIVGGGPAGSSCAWELGRNGRECLILERQELPKFKLCAGWITPKVLQDLEIDPRSYPFGILELDEIRVYLGRSPFSLAFPAKQYSVRRTEFDNWLLERSGAEVVRHQARSILLSDGLYAIDGQFRCRYLVGAGGTNCPVRKVFFPEDRGGLLLTQEIEYGAKARDRTCTLFYPFAGWAGYGWHVPKADGVNIGFGAVASQFKGNIKSYWDNFVEILMRRGLIDAPPPAPASYPYHLGDRRKIVSDGNAFIVGDAAGLATVDMGAGIGTAVESGLLAARQILGLDLYDLERVTQYTLEGFPGRVMERLCSGHFIAKMK